MTIDAHQHFWIFDPERDAWITEDMSVIRKNFLPADLAPVLEANGIDGCVAVQADQSEAETDFLLQLAEENTFIKGVVGWVDLRSPSVEERLQHYAQYPLLRGFRHIVQGEADPAFLQGEDFCRGIKALAAYDLTYDILIFPQQLPAALQFVQQFPGQRFVIDHLAKPYIRKGEVKGWEEDMRAMAQFDHVYCKLSGMVTEADMQNWKQEDFSPYLDVALEAFGADRLMYGSDWPVCLLAADYPQVKKLVTDHIAHLSVAEQARIMGGNAASFYKLV